MTVLLISTLLIAALLLARPAHGAESTREALWPRLDPSKPLGAPRHEKAYVVAHRGAHVGIPENTIAAYERAIELNVDMLEIDVQTTKDGRFISMHNEEIDRYVVDGSRGLVAEMTLDELKALDIGSRVGPEWREERVPAFEEILDVCRGKCGIYLDLKCAPVAPLVEMIQARKMDEQIFWYASDAQLAEAAELCPASTIMPDPGPIERLHGLVERFRPWLVAAVWGHYSEAFVEKCHEAGAIVIVDEGDRDSWADALAWGTDGIQTDYVEELIAFLEGRASG